MMEWRCFASLNGMLMATPVACAVAACFPEQAGGLLSPADLLYVLRRRLRGPGGRARELAGQELIKVPVR